MSDELPVGAVPENARGRTRDSVIWSLDHHLRPAFKVGYEDGLDGRESRFHFHYRNFKNKPMREAYEAGHKEGKAARGR